MRISKNIYLAASGKMGFDWTHPSDCNVYFIDCGNNQLALIDTGTGDSVDAIVNHVNQYGFSIEQVKYIFLTHIHADHSGGAAELKKKSGAKVALWWEAKKILATGDEEAMGLPQARKAGFYPLDYRISPCKVDLELKDGDKITIGDLEFSVCSTPGHSQYDISFFVKDQSSKMHLFSGDTIFFDGKVSLLNSKDSNIQSLSESINKISRNKVDALFPGHFQPALSNGDWHIQKANRDFQNLKIPTNII